MTAGFGTANRDLSESRARPTQAYPPDLHVESTKILAS